MILYKFGWPFRVLFPGMLWKLKTKKKEVYLTFDDGPIPEVTEYVLDELKQHQVKATFFCVGENIEKHPTIFKRILNEGHQVGNHTYNHLNGKYTSLSQYLENTEKCMKQIAQFSDSKLMRPPYGRISYKQRRGVRSLGLKLVMWDVLGNDFYSHLSAEENLYKSLKYTERGSIVLFHDNVKTFAKIKLILPQYLSAMKEKGYSFKTL